MTKHLLILVFLLVACAAPDTASEQAPSTETQASASATPASLVSVYIERLCSGHSKTVVIENPDLEPLTLEVDDSVHQLDNIEALRFWIADASDIQVRSALQSDPIIAEIQDCVGTETPVPISAQADLSISPIIRTVDCTASISPHPPISDTMGVAIINSGAMDSGAFTITSNRFAEPIRVDNLAAQSTLILILPDWEDYIVLQDTWFEMDVDVNERVPESNEDNNRLQIYAGCVRPT